MDGMINMKYRAVPASLLPVTRLKESQLDVLATMSSNLSPMSRKHKMCTNIHMCSGMLNKAETLKPTDWQTYGGEVNLNQM